MRTIFQTAPHLHLGRVITVKCLTQGHNLLATVGLELTTLWLRVKRLIHCATQACYTRVFLLLSPPSPPNDTMQSHVTCFTQDGCKRLPADTLNNVEWPFAEIKTHQYISRMQMGTLYPYVEKRDYLGVQQCFGVVSWINNAKTRAAEQTKPS